MYTMNNQTTIECCLSLSIYSMLLSFQSITNQTSILFMFVLNYEFSLVFLFPFVFAIPFIPLPFPFPTILDPISFPMIKCRYENRRRGFPSVFIPTSRSPRALDYTVGPHGGSHRMHACACPPRPPTHLRKI
jgi:hypothetical protein